MQAFNLFNHANYYVQNGDGINQLQYNPIGTNCGDGATSEPDLLSGAQLGSGQFRSPAGNQPQRPSARVAVFRTIHVLGSRRVNLPHNAVPLIQHPEDSGGYRDVNVQCLKEATNHNTALGSQIHEGGYLLDSPGRNT